jgi:hypothetical protein
MAIANAANVSLEPKPRTDTDKAREQKGDHADKRQDGNVDGEQRDAKLVRHTIQRQMEPLRLLRTRSFNSLRLKFRSSFSPLDFARFGAELLQRHVRA